MKDGKIEVLEPADLIRVYTSAGKVYAVTERANASCAFGCTRRSSG